MVSRILFLVIVCLAACQGKPGLEQWKQEIRDTERQFAQAALTQGLEAAFIAFAADSAVLMRNNKLFAGKEQIQEFFSMQKLDSTVKLEWEPDFVDVAASGDLAYSYGSYVFSYQDSEGEPRQQTGIFHTVWKRQADGTWKFVWD